VVAFVPCRVPVDVRPMIEVGEEVSRLLHGLLRCMIVTLLCSNAFLSMTKRGEF
jgi:hypothetical protein